MVHNCTCCKSIIRVPDNRPRVVPAVVRWETVRQMAWLCQSCLDIWLDNADDDPSLEPTNVVWLAKLGA